MRRLLIVLLLGAAGIASAGTAQIALAPDLRALKFEPSVSLPQGVEYHLIREFPDTHGVQALIRMPKKYVLPKHEHAHDEFLLVVEGSLFLRVGLDEELEYGPGGYARLPKGVSHGMRTGRWKGAVFLMETDGPYRAEFGEKPTSSP